ncbi:MAG: histidinol-phosphate transaminase [Lactobacillus sp.]|jgi:histidinol-phosphate aminotransferase|nr:histidinol-phosphate transaminase [Lactobacillus sp.]MCI2033559.1 histidinol-phosphate transaminase [Lactobacillus sp.]
MLKPSVTQLHPYVPETPLPDLEKQLGVSPIVRLSANENPFGTSPAVQKAIQDFDFSTTRQYPDGDANQLRQAVAKFTGIPAEQLLFGCGLDEVIELVARTFLSPGDEMVEPWPTFGEYKIHAQIENATIIDVPVLADGQFDVDGLLAAITPKTKLLWLCNPNNPTGTFLPLTQMRALLQRVPKHVLVMIDEAYVDFVTDESQPSALALIPEFDNIVVMRTFSKIYGLAAMRVGYAVIPQALVAAMQAVRLPYNLNSISQTAALAALADQEFVANTQKRVASARTQWEDFLAANGYQYDHSQANFIFFRAPQAAQLKDYLLHHGFLVRDGLGPDWLRITFGTDAQNRQIQALMTAFYA